MIEHNRATSMTHNDAPFQNGTLHHHLTVASQYVEEMIDLVLVVNSHLCGALRAQHWVVHLILVHPSQTAVRGPWSLSHLGLGGRLLMSAFFLVSLLLRLWSFVAQDLLFVHSAVHHKHGSVLRPVLIVPVVRTKQL